MQTFYSAADYLSNEKCPSAAEALVYENELIGWVGGWLKNYK